MQGTERWRPALRGGALAAVLLAVFVPLFASADEAFAEIVGRAVPEEVDVPLARILALAAVVTVGGAIVVASRRGAGRPARAAAPRLARLDWLIPLTALVLVFAGFVGVQFTTLFAGHDHVLRTTGLTYAGYAHRGFGELIVSAALTLAVIAIAWRYARQERLLRALLAALCALSLVVMASAHERLGLYEEAYGLTRLRLMADAHILWLAAVLAMTGVAVVIGRAGWLPHAVVGVSAAGALAFALINPDARIAADHVDRRDRDVSYLSGLSADAAPELARLRADAPCAVARIRRSLEEPDGLAGANRARTLARRAVAGVPVTTIPCPMRGNR